MKGYIVIENWDNCKEYDDHDFNTKVIALCATREIAERIISRRRAELISLAMNYEKHNNVRVNISDYKTANNIDGILIENYVHQIIPNIFASDSTFDWEIKEFPFIDH